MTLKGSRGSVVFIKKKKKQRKGGGRRKGEREGEKKIEIYQKYGMEGAWHEGGENVSTVYRTSHSLLRSMLFTLHSWCFMVLEVDG